MALRFNPNWGMRSGCFPAEPASLTSSNTIREADASRTAEIISRRWTPTLTSQLTPEERQELQTRAISVTNQLRDLSNFTEGTTSKFQVVVQKITSSGGALTRDVNTAWSQARASMTDLTTKKSQTFTNLDLLMVYAPDPSTAQHLCQEKLIAENSYQTALTKIAEANSAINGKFSEFYEKQDQWYDQLINLFKTFLAALQAILTILLEAFKVSVGLLLWAKDHPKTAVAVGSVVALVVLAIALRPYIMLYMAAT